jgi:hypothetical protein
MRDLLDKLTSIENTQESLIPELGDSIGFSFSPDLEVVTEVVGFTEDGIVVELDDIGLNHLTENGTMFLDEAKGPCWVGYKQVGMKNKGGKQVPNCVKEDDDVEESGLQRYTGIKKYGKKGFEELQKAGLEGASEEEKGAIKDKYLKKDTKKESVEEAEYRGKNVPLGKKLPGDVKKSKVYVRKPNGNIVKVNFGDKKMRIKKSNPKRRKSFRARHNCKNPGPRWKARYWSCRSW